MGNFCSSGFDPHDKPSAALIPRPSAGLGRTSVGAGIVGRVSAGPGPIFGRISAARSDDLSTKSARSGSRGSAVITVATALATARKELVRNKGVRFEQRYQIHRLLGRGAFAKVVECTRKGSEDRYAAKIIEKGSMDRKALEKEVAVSRLLEDHPATLPCVYDVFEDDDNYYVVFELCRGGELFERIVKKKHFSEREAARYLRTLLSFVAHAHSRGVVHTDLKPENVLLLHPVAADADDDKVFIKVVDYGCSNFCADGEFLTQPYGTPMYAAPEIFKSCFDKSADIWSLGVISHVLLVGYAPFRGVTPEEIKRKVIAAEYDLDGQGWQSVSPAAKAFVGAMLQTRPGARPSAASLLRHIWFTQAQESNTSLRGTVSRLRLHLQKGRFERLALRLLARSRVNAAADDALAMRAVFEQFDQDRNGTLDYDEFCSALHKGEQGAPDAAELRALFDAADLDRTGRIDYEEFLAATGGCGLTSRPTLAATLVLQQLDRDGDGFVTVEELAGAMHPGATLSEARSLLRSADLDGDGRIDLEEIKAVIRAK
ncbi:hypothetical protein HYH03_017368 [Edaphochlamys debaryana]|uniref:Calcium-dependent protein kinase n=1 Tax=Edaphochlamys debaryana TaxID=47281 RepID=A0A835XK66_9CHLO|nr:hypothetical protein HYH03_017368 [Edaphochlamys debaryana]|eukprot:KAG2483771.1 hypothetical protein HYH03_017368 [Edaphochlamys debaryana]